MPRSAKGFLSRGFAEVQFSDFQTLKSELMKEVDFWALGLEFGRSEAEVGPWNVRFRERPR